LITAMKKDYRDEKIEAVKFKDTVVNRSLISNHCITKVEKIKKIPCQNGYKSL